MSEVLVTGATGTTGSRVAAFLTGRGVAVRRATRTPKLPGQIRFDWADRQTYKEALHGISAVYLIAPIGVADPVPLVQPFLGEALDQGVQRVVQLSSSALPEGAPGLGAVHHLVRTTMPEWTVLRPSWFMQNFTGDHLVAQGVRDGEIVTAAADGKVAFIDAADIAAIVTEVTGRPVVHHRLTHEQLRDRLAAFMPLEFATMLADMDRAIADGAEDRTTGTVQLLTGRPPNGFRAVAERELSDPVSL